MGYRAYEEAKPGFLLWNFFEMHVDFVMWHNKIDFAAKTHPDTLLGHPMAARAARRPSPRSAEKCKCLPRPGSFGRFKLVSQMQ